MYVGQIYLVKVVRMLVSQEGLWLKFMYYC